MSKVYALDTETMSLDDRTLVGFSLATNNKSRYYPIAHNKIKNCDKIKSLKMLQNIIENNKIIMHNSAFDIPVLVSWGVPQESFKDVEDTLIIAQLVNENIRHGLKGLIKRYLHYQMVELKEIVGTGKKRISVADADKRILKYAADDSKYTLQLYYFLYPKLLQDKNVLEVYQKIEKPLLKVVSDMHINGISIDVKKVKKIKDKCESIINLAEVKLRIEMGEDTNFNSTQQLNKYFIGVQHMPVIKQSSKTGKPSMDKEVLEKYAETNAVAKTLLEFRKYSKIMSTFIPALTPSEWDLDTLSGKIHANFNQAGTTSGRFSSSRPNMQNIPRANEEDGIKIREAIVPDQGEILIGADYSQIELRVLAHFSRDPNLIKAYNENKDIHQQTADACGCSRYNAKTVNFGLVYGMGSRTLAKKIKVSVEEAQQYIDRYFDTYSGVKEFWAKSEKAFKELGYVETLSGRKRRRSDNFEAKDSYDQGGEVRSATNAIIQGSAADMMKIAMINMYPQLKKYGARIILTCHDEVLVSSPIKYKKQVFAVVHRSMVEAGKDLSVPVTVNCKFGKSWEEAHG